MDRIGESEKLERQRERNWS